MKKYRVLTKWLTLNGFIEAGGEVELPEHEAAPFLGRVLEAVAEDVSAEPAIADDAPAEPDAEPVKKKKATT